MALAYDKVNALVNDTLLPILKNNIFDSNIYAGRALGKAKTHSSTVNIRTPLEYARNSAQGMIAKYTKLNLQVPEPFTDAAYTPITAYQALSIAWEDELEWTSELAVKNGIQALMKNAERSFKKMFAEKIYQAAASKGTNDIEPLLNLINATTTVGGIAVADAAWWVSNVLTSTTFGSTAISTEAVLVDPSSAGFIEKILRRLVSISTFDGRKPTVLICAQHLFDIMDQVISDSINRPVSIKRSGQAVEKMGSMGFDAMQFRGIPIIADDELYAAQASDTTSYLFAINEDTLHFDVNSKANMVHEPFASPVGQLTRTSKILWRGNLTIANRKESSVVTGLLSAY